LCFGADSFFLGGLWFKPLVVWGCLVFHWRYLIWAPCVLGLLHFSCEVFWFEPLVFWGCSFFIRGLWYEPLVIWGCLFFHRRSFDFSPLHFALPPFHQMSLILAHCILGVPLFHRMSFDLNPVHFGVAAFSSEVFDLSQWPKVMIKHFWLWLWLAISMTVINVLGKWSLY
jgi:hypothetical protein